MKSYKTSPFHDKTLTFAPSSLLIFWSSAIFIPLSLLVALDSLFTIGIIAIGASFCLLVAIDLWLSMSCLQGMKLFAPERLRLSKNKARSLTVSFVNESATLNQLNVRLRLPAELSVVSNEQLIKPLLQGKRYSLNWMIQGSELGAFNIEGCEVSTLSTFRFWSIRRIQSVACDVRVYPNLMSAQGELASLFLNRNLGVHARSMIGKGREFEQLREYIPGDSYEDIHWRATAKRNHPITKTYQLERTQSVYVIIDASRLSARRLVDQKIKHNDVDGERLIDEKTTILEKYISATLMLGLVSSRQGDNFGVLSYSDRVLNFYKANSGQSHFNAVRDSLYTLKPQLVSPDFSELFTFIGTRIRHRALLIFLTNLDDPLLSEDFVEKVRIINKKHFVMVNSLTPRGHAEMFSAGITPESGLYERLAGHMVWETAYKTKKILRSHHVDYSLFDQEHLMVDMVSQYMTIKQRQVL